jgi:hypothetical protein
MVMVATGASIAGFRFPVSGGCAEAENGALPVPGRRGSGMGRSACAAAHEMHTANMHAAAQQVMAVLHERELMVNLLLKNGRMEKMDCPPSDVRYGYVMRNLEQRMEWIFLNAKRGA